MKVLKFALWLLVFALASLLESEAYWDVIFMAFLVSSGVLAGIYYKEWLDMERAKLKIR